MSVLCASSADVRVLHGGPGRLHTWVEPLEAVANAGMFDMESGQPVGALVAGGRVVNRWPITWPLFIIRGGRAEILRAGEWKEYWDLDHCDHAVSCAPLLVWEGKRTDLAREIVPAGVNPGARVGRTAVGVTTGGDVLLLVEMSATLAEVQQQLIDAGAVAALNLDGGGSSVLYRRGELIDGQDVRPYPSAIALTRLKSDHIPDAGEMVPVITDLLPADSPVRPGERIQPLWITIHSTANPGATARDHAAYLRGTEAAKRQVSWHWTVDDREAIQHLPETEMGWHAGSRDGNRLSIGVEICEFEDKARQQRAIDNAAWLVAQISQRWPGAGIVPHQRWMPSKACPRILLEQPDGWKRFIEAVKAHLKGEAAMRTLRLGDVGTDVRMAQQYLKDQGFDPGPVDGIFGARTEAAVRAFQAAEGLVVDGVIGPQTWGALRAKSQPEPEPQEPEDIEALREELRATKDELERLRTGLRALLEQAR